MELITDRSPADIQNEKGRYTFADLNRVERAVQILAAYAKVVEADPGLLYKTDWGLPGVFSRDTWPVKSQMERYLSNVRALRDRYAPQSPLPDSMEKLTIRGANEIESALLHAHRVLTGRLHTFQFSGELIAGEENTV